MADKDISKFTNAELYDLVCKLQAELLLVKKECSTLRTKIPIQEQQEFYTDEEELANETNHTDESEWKTRTKRKKKLKTGTTTLRNPAEAASTPKNSSKKRPAEESPLSPANAADRTQVRATRNRTLIPKPPPITVLKGTKFNILTDLLNKLPDANKNISTKTLSSGDIKVNTANDVTYRAAIDALKSAKIDYFHHQLKTDRPFQVVIRGLNPKTDTDEIKEGLRQAGHQPKAVTNIITKRKTSQGIVRTPLPLFYIDVEAAPNNSDIMKMRVLAQQSISVEAPRKADATPQCMRCLKIGHTKNYCARDFTCFICAGAHHPKDCTRDKNEKPTCANCQGEHIATSKQCRYYIENTKAKPKAAVQQSSAVERILKPATAAKTMMPAKLHPAPPVVTFNSTRADWTKPLQLSERHPGTASIAAATNKPTDKLDLILNKITAIQDRLGKLENTVKSIISSKKWSES
jgi:hypothetical protein